jgi:glyoxylase I family protein
MTHPPFTLQNLDHVVLRVRNMERALKFYCEVLGCTREREVTQIGLVQLRAGSALIDLIPAAQYEAPLQNRNMDHFALAVIPFDEDKIRAHLTAHGVLHGRVEERYGANGAGPSLYIQDPDGNQVELKGPSE